MWIARTSKSLKNSITLSSVVQYGKNRIWMTNDSALNGASLKCSAAAATPISLVR
eukprot:TRINITY_DN1281_c0_g1_i1.p2 TRINITY_DN1281_c0_g1~~TRINITY_DN1281_c0_g1_i1.p2  ORF type:complete len:55 (+),score=4.44 TRINITY_DN1281_c0_g1_i1:94-258(+)